MGGNVTEALKELLRVFHAANRAFFRKKIITPEITIQSAGRLAAYGWCTVYKVWEGKNGGNWEINISAEYLARPTCEIICTLIHEMVHLYNLQNGVKDCSSNQYHNKHFKKMAERACLIVSRIDPFGWASTTMHPEAKKWLTGLFVNDEAFSVYRRGSRSSPGDNKAAGGDNNGVKPTKPKGPGSKMKKWSCGCTNVRCAIELEATCIKCGNGFKKQEN